MPDFMMFFRHDRTGRRYEQIVEARTGQVALKSIRRFIIAMCDGDTGARS